MSGHARTPSAAIGVRRLTEAELADLLRVAVAQCGRSDEPPAGLPDVMKLVAARLGRGVGEAVLWQVADAVTIANKLPIVTSAYDPLMSVTAAVMSAREAPPDALHALLVEAWKAYEPESLGSAPEPASLEDPERTDLERLTLAGRYFLLAHKDSGELLVSEPVCALGLAGALLSELLLADVVRFSAATGKLAARGEVAVPSSVSPVAEQAAARLRQPYPLRSALDHVASDAYERMRGLLLYTDILIPRQKPQLLPFAPARTLFPPARPRLPERVFNAVAALPTTDASHLDLRDAALIELARATGLPRAARRQWWMAEKVPTDEATARNPGLSHLIGQVAAVVTTTVAVRQR